MTTRASFEEEKKESENILLKIGSSFERDVMKSSDEERDAALGVPAADFAAPSNTSSREDNHPVDKKQTVRQRVRSIMWDTLDRSPEERRLIAKIDFFILTWASLTYFSKNLNTNNLCTCTSHMVFPTSPFLFPRRRGGGDFSSWNRVHTQDNIWVGANQRGRVMKPMRTSPE